MGYPINTPYDELYLAFLLMVKKPTFHPIEMEVREVWIFIVLLFGVSLKFLQ